MALFVVQCGFNMTDVASCTGNVRPSPPGPMNAPKKSPRRNSAVDMDSIARQLGVSKTTVHYVLAGKGRVSEAVRSQVLAKASKMGYRPNLLARGLRTKRTQTLGVILSSLTSSFHAHLLESMDHAAQQVGYSIFLACSYRDPDKEQELIEMMLSKGVDGIIIAPISTERARPIYNRMNKDGVAIVFVDRDLPKSHIDCVSVDNFAGGRLAAAHLLECGRRKIAFVTMVYKGQQSSTLQERLNGCNDAMQGAGLPPVKVLGLDTENQTTGEIFGYKAVARTLSDGEFSFDGLFTANDNLAYGAFMAIREAGLRIPQDVAVVGFDDQDPSAFVDPPLTTIRQPVHSVGAAAVEKLLHRLNADPKAERTEAERVKIEPTLVRRTST